MVQPLKRQKNKVLFTKYFFVHKIKGRKSEKAIKPNRGQAVKTSITMDKIWWLQ